MAATAERPTSPVFVVGYARSGTTLMRFLLTDHSDLAVAPETHFVDHFWTRNRWVDIHDRQRREELWSAYLSSKPFLRWGLEADTVRASAGPAGFADFRDLFSALLRAHAAMHGKARAGEKTPDHYMHLDTLFDWFPDARVVFMIRDPRGVVASHLHVKEAWAQGATPYLVGLQWTTHLATLAQWRDDRRVRVVRYESLVTDPEGELRAVLAFAGLRDEARAILDRRPTERRDTGSLSEVTRVSDENVEAWRSRLSRWQLAEVEAVTQEGMTALGYQPATSAAFRKVVANLGRARRVTRRLARRQSVRSR